MSAREIPPDVPGRGAWKTTGGLLPLKPGKKTGYYRRSKGTEVMVGRAGSRLAATYSERCVWHGVRQFQARLDIDDDGLYGDDTLDAVLRFQEAHAELGKPDGIIGPATSQAIFAPLIRSIAAEYGISARMLGGAAKWESGLDPAAVGVNGLDTGFCQINLGAHDLPIASACDVPFALDFSAKDMRRVMDKWAGKTSVDLEKIAVANHNSPALAAEWARTGRPPYSESRAANRFPQIDQYVASVEMAGEAFS